MASEKKYSYIAIVGAMMLWSVSFVWSKLAFESYNPFTVLFFRLFIAAISLFIVSKAFGLLQKIDKGDYKILLLLSFFEPFLYFQYLPGSEGTIIELQIQDVVLPVLRRVIALFIFPCSGSFFL